MKPVCIRSKGKILNSEEPLIMGILNATPDSFYSGSRTGVTQVVDMAGSMIEGGAAILDLGGQSTRPGAVRISAEEESDRILPLIESIRFHFPDIWISIDTFYAAIARQAVLAGADIINDVSAGDDDPEMLETIAALSVPFVAMHKKGDPLSMQKDPQYGNVVSEVLAYLIEKKARLESAGIYDWIADPGFGFGKTLEHNYSLLRHLETFQILDRPVMAGVSRKGMIQKPLGVTAAEALNGTTAIHMFALSKGAAILRVHDVREAKECIRLWQCIASAP